MMAFCGKCGKEVKDGAAFCGSCGAAQATAARPPRQGTAPARRAARPEQGSANLPASATGFAARYDEGAMAVFAGVVGIVLGIIALFTFSGTWLSLKPVLGFGDNTPCSLLEVSEIADALGSLTAYFSSGATTTLQVVSVVATLSYWVLLLGSILMIVVSILLFVNPKAEAPALAICAVVTTAFAIIGLIFTAAPILMGDYLAFTPLPIVMLIFAGIPAALYRLL